MPQQPPGPPDDDGLMDAVSMIFCLHFLTPHPLYSNPGIVVEQPAKVSVVALLEVSFLVCWITIGILTVSITIRAHMDTVGRGETQDDRQQLEVRDKLVGVFKLPKV